MTSKTIKNILINLKNSDFENVSDFINSYDSYADKGHIFEVLIDVMQRSKFIPDFKDFKPVYGSFGNENFNGAVEKEMSVFLEEKFNNGNSQGAIDLLLKNDEKKELIALTFKFFKQDDPKDFEKYDVYKMLASKNQLEEQFKDFNISFGIVTNCEKEKLKNKLKKTKTNSKKEIKYILTIENIQIYFQNFKNFLKKNKNIKNALIKKSNEKVSSIQLKFYQEYAYNSIMNTFKNYDIALLGAIPRFGKTYVFGKIATNYKNVLFLSSVVSNIKEDLTSFITSQKDF